MLMDQVVFKRHHPSCPSSWFPTTLGKLVSQVELLRSKMTTCLFFFVKGCATQMIETIWPRSISKSQELIELRAFVQITLEQFKTTYSTLQVALYYLLLIRGRRPMENCSAIQCGRRMFLAALLLASKYHLDSKFTAHTWSKISGLEIEEINANEKIFLTAVNWKLHIPLPVFSRWTNFLMNSPSTQPSTFSARLDDFEAASALLKLAVS